jgi:type IV secretory pathway VirB3-like protein
VLIMVSIDNSLVLTVVVVMLVVIILAILVFYHDYSEPSILLECSSRFGYQVDIYYMFAANS